MRMLEILNDANFEKDLFIHAAAQIIITLF